MSATAVTRASVFHLKSLPVPMHLLMPFSAAASDQPENAQRDDENFLIVNKRQHIRAICHPVSTVGENAAGTQGGGRIGGQRPCVIGGNRSKRRIQDAACRQRREHA